MHTTGTQTKKQNRKKWSFFSFFYKNHFFLFFVTFPKKIYTRKRNLIKRDINHSNDKKMIWQKFLARGDLIWLFFRDLLPKKNENFRDHFYEVHIFGSRMTEISAISMIFSHNDQIYCYFKLEGSRRSTVEVITKSMQKSGKKGKFWKFEFS